jgi:hypothetical protein
MAKNQALLLVELKDILFAEETITKDLLDREHIFELKDSSQATLGFISMNDLKAYSLDHDEEVQHYTIRNIDAFEWNAVFEHPLFQRRKPQVVAAKAAIDLEQQFFILKHGQKAGPFKKDELVNMLDDKDLLLTDMVSYNAGHTWMKLYQLENFDRRVLKESDHLPGVPLEAINQINDHVNNISPATEAISSLAYLSNVKRGKSIERDANQNFQADKTYAPSTMSIHKWLLVLSLIGTGYFLYTLKNQLTSPFKDEPVAIGEQAEVLTPVENPDANSRYGQQNRVNQINDQQRAGGKFESRHMNPVTPRSKKSFMDSAQYQAIDNGADDPNYFYDNTSAMELDPVRSQVSKENYDNSGADDGPIPSQDTVFENEVSN